MIEELTDRPPPPHEQRSIGCYRLNTHCNHVESKLSECEFGMVMLGEHQLTNQTVMVRIIIK